MQRLLITGLAGGLLFAAATARAATLEPAGEGNAQEIANVNTTSQEHTQGDVTLAAKKPRLRFRSSSGTTKTCGASGLGEKEIHEAEQKRLKKQQQAQQQVKNSNDNSHNGTEGGGDDKND